MAKDNLWELRRLPDISPHISSHLCSEDIQMGQEILQAYDKHILPVLGNFQSGIGRTAYVVICLKMSLVLNSHHFIIITKT